MLRRISSAISLRSRSSGNYSSSSSATMDEVYKNSEVIHSSDVPTHLRKHSFVVPVDSKLVDYGRNGEPDISIDPFDAGNTLKRTSSFQLTLSKKLSLSRLRKKSPKAVRFQENQGSASSKSGSSLESLPKAEMNQAVMEAVKATDLFDDDDSLNGCENQHLPYSRPAPPRSLSLPKFLPTPTSAEPEFEEHQPASIPTSESEFSSAENSSAKSFFNFDYAPSEETQILLSQIKKEINPDCASEIVAGEDIRAILEEVLEFIDSKKQQLHQAETANSTLRSYSEATSNVENQRDYLAEENSQFKEKLSFYANKNDSLQSCLDQKFEELKTKELEADALKVINSALKEKLAANEIRNADLVETIDTVEQLLEPHLDSTNSDFDICSGIDSVISRNEQLTSEVDKLKKESKENMAQLEEKVKIITRLHRDIKTANVLRQELELTHDKEQEKTRKENEAKLQELGRRFERLSNQNQKLQERNEHLRSDVEILRDELESRLGRENTLGYKLEVTSNKNDQLTKELDAKNKELEDLNHGVEELSKSVAGIIDEKDATIEKLALEVSREKKSAGFLEQNLKEKEKELKQRAIGFDKFTKEASQSNSRLLTLEAKTGELQSSNEKILSQNDEIKTLLKSVLEAPKPPDSQPAFESLLVSNMVLVEFTREVLGEINHAIRSMLQTATMDSIEDKLKMVEHITIYDHSHQPVLSAIVSFYVKVISFTIDQFTENEKFISSELKAQSRSFTKIMDKLYNGVITTQAETTMKKQLSPKKI